MRKPASWFFDSVTLSNFALVGRMDILSDRYRRQGFVTTQVVDELTRGAAAGHAPLADCLDLVDQGVFHAVTLDKTERHTFRQIIGHLGEGEAGTIAAADPSSNVHGISAVIVPTMFTNKLNRPLTVSTLETSRLHGEKPK
jgi:hypothetical protein